MRVTPKKLCFIYLFRCQTARAVDRYRLCIVHASIISLYFGSGLFWRFFFPLRFVTTVAEFWHFLHRTFVFAELWWHVLLILILQRTWHRRFNNWKLLEILIELLRWGITFSSFMMLSRTRTLSEFLVILLIKRPIFTWIERSDSCPDRIGLLHKFVLFLIFDLQLPYTLML